MSARVTIDAAEVVMGYADAPGETYKDVYCELDSSWTLQRDEVAEKTKNCGTLKQVGPQNNTVSGNLAVITDQESDEASHDELILLYTSKARKYWRWTNTDGDIFIGGYGYLNSYNPSAPVEGVVKAAFTVSIDGDIDTAEPS